MKRHSPAMNKPSVNKLDRDLDRYKPNTNSNKVYLFECPSCRATHTFKETDLVDRVIKCKNCGYEEVFFSCNYGG